MPNPNGYNAFGGPMEREQPYGAIQKLKSMTSLAATAQPASVGAPRRAQRHATGQDKPRGARASSGRPQGAPQPPAPPPVAGPSYDQVLGSFWQELASDPGASPLIREIAAGA